jgi:hypothetical protein
MRLFAALLLVLVGLPGLARADGLPPVPDQPPLMQAKPPPDRIFLLSIQGDVGVQPSEPMTTVYKHAQPMSFHVRGTWLFGERFGIGLGAGVQGRTGVGIAPEGVDPPLTALWQIPIQIEGSMRLLLWKTQPVVPYLRTGFDAVVWTESWDAGDGGKDSLTGLKWGVHAAGGAQFRLPFPEINQPGRMVGDPVLDDIYLHVEGWARSASNFGSSGLDLSSAGGGIGLTLLM